MLLKSVATGMLKSRICRAFYSKSKIADLNLHPDLVVGLEKNKITALTQVQEDSLLSSYKFETTCILSETGSGKTLAYGIPLINHM